LSAPRFPSQATEASHCSMHKTYRNQFVNLFASDCTKIHHFDTALR
jgi:hypothetical protein